VPGGVRTRQQAVSDETSAAKGPHGGTTLSSLDEIGAQWTEHEGLTLLAGEAEGHATAQLVGAGDGWLLVLAADAWIAMGPTDSKPYAIEIGPHSVEVEPGYGPGYVRKPPEPRK